MLPVILMAVSPVPAQLERFENADRGSLRLYVGFFLATLICGLALALGGFLAQPQDGSSNGLFLKLGGTFVAALGTFPLKECIAIRSRIQTLAAMRAMWQDYADQPTPPEAELQRVKELVWKLYEKRALT